MRLTIEVDVFVRMQLSEYASSTVADCRHAFDELYGSSFCGCGSVAFFQAT